MNIRKPTDYVTMFTTLDTLMAAQLPQMEMYCEIGRLVSGRVEKGAAVAASEYLQAAYPAAEGFSPRNLRRMRAFYAAYEKTPEIMRLAMRLGWTQNVAILERCGNNEERAWYIRAALRFGWKKKKLLESIKTQAWLYSSLDEQAVSCYTGENEVTRECESDEEDTLCVSWQYLPQPHGRVRDEGLGKKGGTGIAISYRISGYQSGGDRQPSLSSGTAQAGRAWDLLRRPCRTAVDKSGLRRIRSPDRHGPGQPPDMYRICGGDYVGKMSLLMDHTAHPGNVADPWYTEDFEATWQDVLDGCQGLLKEFMTERGDSNGTKR